jgi:hypothetical protein
MSMRKLTIAQRRRWKRLGPPPAWDEREAERENAGIKADCENRMMVFDMAPRLVRNRANELGEPVVKRWARDLFDSN